MRSSLLQLLGKSVFALLFISTSSYAAVFNVTSSSGGNCAADSNACTLQEALLEASKNQQADTINLAAGIYDSSKNISNNIPIPFSYLAKAGPDENFPLEIIGSADGNTVITGSGIQQGLYIVTAVLGNDDAANVTVKGLRFENTVGSLTVLSKSADLNFEQNIQENGSQGMNVTTETGALNINGNTIQNEKVVDNYKAIDLTMTNSVLQLKDNIFRNNRGVTSNSVTVLLKADNGSATIEGNTWQSNQLGSVLAGDAKFQLKIMQNNFVGNDFVLGAVGMVYLSTDKNVEFSRNTISGNKGQAQFNVAIQSTVGDVTADRNYFFDNSSAIISVFTTQSGKSFVTNNLLVNNTSYVGTLRVGSTMGEVNLIQNTLAQNDGAQAGAIYLSLSQDTAKAKIYNNIIFDNLSASLGSDLLIDDDGDGNNVGSSVELSHNIFSQLESGCSDPCVPAINQEGNLDVDPLFIDASENDFHLAADSPAIGAGDPNAPFLPELDLDAVTRKSPPDIGAYQVVANLSVDPLSIDYGNISIEVPNSRLVTLSNRGGLELNVSGIILDDTDNYALDFNRGDQPCASAAPTLAPGESCTVQLDFQPQNAGTFAAKLSINSNDPDSPSIIVALSGVGVDENPTSADGGCSLNPRDHSARGWALSLLPLLVLALRRFKRA